jgi:cadherin
VHIRVKDVNDLPPVFEQTSYETTIPEEESTGLPRRILKV